MRDPDVSALRWGLVVVDMQRYYLDPAAAFTRYHQHCDPGCLDYIVKRCADHVIPNICRLISMTRQSGRPVIFLRLCGQEADRSDLHPVFQAANKAATLAGFADLYPLQSDPFSEVLPDLDPNDGDIVVCKTTFSGFTSSALPAVLKQHGLERLVFTGLATSQCVETTARDAADREFQIVHVEDAQADYSETTHRASLHSSQGVCGGHITSTNAVLDARWFH